MTAHDLGLIRTGLRVRDLRAAGDRVRRLQGLPHPGGRQDRHVAEDAGRRTTPGSWGTPRPTTREILVVALVEQGGHGSSVAAPVVRRVMEQYFGIKAGAIDVAR